MYRKKTVAVIFGGQSSEHEVSRNSATMMLRELDKEKYQVLPVGITKKGEWLIYNGPADHVATGEWEKYGTPACLSPDASKKALLKIVNNSVKEIPVDVAIPVLHGAWGEDGTIQGLLELAQIPYVGCGVLSSAVSMDKVYTKMIAKQSRIPQAPYLWTEKHELNKNADRFMNQVEKKLGYPCFVKPSNAGSSVGISKAKNRAQLKDALALAAQYDSRTVIPADIPEDKLREMQRIAARIFRAVDGSGLARVDFFMEKDTDKIYFNELNTMPGFTTISMYPMLWEEAGISKTELMDRLIELALARDTGIRG